MLLKRSLVSLACLGLLTACGVEEETEDTSTSTYVLHSMSEVELGYQTFQQRALSYDDMDVDVDESTYIYKDRENDDSTAVIFNSANSSGTNTEELVIVDAADINDTYTAFSIDDVKIKVESVNYDGDYILIQNKESGDLYPVVSANYEPLYNTELSDDIFWMSAYRNSNIADEDRIYLNDSSQEILYIFEFDGDYFVYIDTFEYNGDSFWVNEDGDILTQGENAKSEISLFERSSEETISETFSTSNLLPFIYNGEFYSARSSSSIIYDLDVGTDSFSWNDDSVVFSSNDDGYEPTLNAARRGKYEMSADCKLYEFNDENPFSVTIDLIDDFENEGVENGQLAVAGQEALFCIYAESDDDTASPIILKYDIDVEEASNYTVSEGDLSDATDNFTVISDNEVMFSEAESGTFEEHYVNLEEATDETIEVTESSIILLQRLEDL